MRATDFPVSSFKILHMDFDSLKNIITNADTNTFVVDGEKKRLFYSANGYICEFMKGSTKRGYILSDPSISNIKTCLPYAVDNALLYKRLETLIFKLEKSGLWCDLKDALKILHSKGFEEFNRYASFNYSQCREWEDANNAHIGLDSLINTLKKGFKSINFDSTNLKNHVTQCFNQRIELRTAWRKGYDNSIEYSPSRNKAWYSEEYKNCGNGHYYLMINATQAIFCEDD